MYCFDGEYIMSSFPKYIKDIETKVTEKLKLLQIPSSELLESQQNYHDEILEVFREAFTSLISKTISHSQILEKIKNAYEKSLQIRNERISQFITQDRREVEEMTSVKPRQKASIQGDWWQICNTEGGHSVLDSHHNYVIKRIYNISANKKLRDNRIVSLKEEIENTKEQNRILHFEISKLKNEMGKLNADKFSDYLHLMRERDARYTLYFENVNLHMKVKELDGSSSNVDDTHGDPVILRIALNRCREQLTATNRDLRRMQDEYADTVPTRDFEILSQQFGEAKKQVTKLQSELTATQDAFKKNMASKECLEEELLETRERCRELERSGTPRPQWELCADFISGGKNRWWQLADGLSSRDTLRVLLKELGPAAESDHLEHFDGLGLDPVLPPYLRYEGKVRNLRLSRREISVIINDIWLGKLQHPELTMQDYVNKYFENRYQQPSVRAEWAYNLCAGAEQMLDEPQVKLFWGVLHGHLSDRIYWGHRAQWQALKDSLYKQSKDGETVTIEEFEKTAKTIFPLKSEVDIKNLTDVMRKQLKIKMNSNEVNLDKLFYENEEGFDRVEFARELYRQRQLAQDKYIREVVAALGGRRTAAKPVGIDDVKRAFAFVDPAIDHIRMEQYIRWAFSDQTSDLSTICPIPLRSLAARLAAGDIERVGPRYRTSHKRK